MSRVCFYEDVGFRSFVRPSTYETCDKSIPRLELSLGCAALQVRKALLDNFDTPEALVSLQHMVSVTNIYLNTNASVKAPLVKEVATYVMYMLRVSIPFLASFLFIASFPLVMCAGWSRLCSRPYDKYSF